MTIYVTSNTTIGDRPLQAGSQYRLRGSEEDAVVSAGNGYYVEQPSHIPGLLVKDNQVMGIVDADGRAMLYSQAVPIYAYTPRAIDGTATDAKNVTFLPATGQATRTVEDKLRDVVNAKDYGVKADNSTDNTAALNALLASGAGRIMLPPGTIRATGIVDFGAAGQTLFGGGPDGTVLRFSGSGYLRCQDRNYCGIEGIKITGASKTSGALLVVRSSSGFQARNIRVENGWNGVDFESTNDATMDNFVVATCLGEWAIRFAGTVEQRADVLKLVNGQISHPSNLGIAAIRWESYAHSMTVGNVRIIRGGRGIHVLKTATGDSNSIATPSFLQVSMLEIDYPQLQGVLAVDLNDAWFSNVYCHESAAECGIELGQNCQSVRMSNMRVTSHWKHGLSTDGRFVQISNSRFYGNSKSASNTWDGIYVGPNSDDTIITGCQSGFSNTFTSQQRYGLNIESGATRAIYDPLNDFAGNVTAPVNGGGDLTHLVAGSTRFVFANANGTQLQVGGSTAAAVNYLRVSGQDAGTSPTIRAEGADANLDIRLVTKGTGVPRLGAWTSNADAAVNGYITVKDEATGTVRKLATIA